MTTIGLTNEKVPLTAALYARVSTENQEKQETIKSQIAEVKKKIESDGNILLPKNVFIDDGWTGMILDRPALDSMRDAIKEGRIQIVYVYDLGRLSRDFTDQLILLREFEQADVKFISLRDINPTTPAEEMMQKIMGIFHDYDRRNTIEKFRRGKLYKARNGVIINGSALYGYKYIKKSEKEPARIELNEKEAEVVRNVFRWVGVDGTSIRGVLMKLYRLGIYPRKRKRDVWSKGPIVRMLKTKTYFDGIGFYNKSIAVVSKNPFKHEKYKKVKKTSRRVRPREEWIPLKVPKLFEDESLFNKVQKILEDNKRYASKNRKYDYLLTGKTYCEHGFKRVGDGYSKGQNHYYRSAARIYQYPKDTNCDCRGVNAVVLDSLFWNKLQGILTNSDLLKKQATKWLKDQNSDSKSNSEEVGRYEKKIEDINNEKMRYVKIFGEGAIDSSQFEELMRGIKSRTKMYQIEVDNLKSKENSKKTEQVDINSLCEEAVRVIKSLDTSNKRQIVRELVEKVVIKKGGDEVETWINIPISQAHQMGYGIERRNCGAAECREIHSFQCSS